MSPDLNRRNFLKATAGATGITGLAGCNTLSDDDLEENDETDTSTSTSEPSYSIQASPLQYDLTTLATSEADQHDQAYVQDNYSAELGITVLENGEEADLEELGEIHLEDEEGERVETTEDGYIPEYAVEDGQELTVRAEINGETVEETIRVNKELPSGFYADARIQEDDEVLYDTEWTTPYNFDNHIVDRQAFLDQRAGRRNELAAEEIITESDLELLRESDEFLKEEKDLDEETLMERRFNGVNAAMKGIGDYEGSDANPNSINVEKAMLDNFDYRPVFVGGFTNPKEPDVPGAGDGDGYPVDSQVAYVEGDWYHVAEDNINARHISEIDEIGMVGDQGGNYGAVSVLAEFERGNTELLDHDNADERVESAVTSPVTLNGNMTELDLSDDISWNTLNEIRDNTEWEEVMVPMELATAIGTDVEGTVSMEGETTKDSKLRVTR